MFRFEGRNIYDIESVMKKVYDGNRSNCDVENSTIFDGEFKPYEFEVVKDATHFEFSKIDEMDIPYLHILNGRTFFFGAGSLFLTIQHLIIERINAGFKSEMITIKDFIYILSEIEDGIEENLADFTVNVDCDRLSFYWMNEFHTSDGELYKNYRMYTNGGSVKKISVRENFGVDEIRREIYFH